MNDVVDDILQLRGHASRIGLKLPPNLSKEEWMNVGVELGRAYGGVSWWIGDWWAFGVERAYGDGEAICERAGLEYQHVMNCGSVARAYEISFRNENVSWTNHRLAMAAPENERQAWLEKAARERLSANELKTAIARQAAIDRTRKVEFDAERLGKFAVLYADPPWRYEHPPMGGSNRSIENHYPTMALEEICALKVGDVAHENAVLFLWATSPKLYECMAVLDAWGFVYRTDMVWVKDKIGMGYYVRQQHESLLIAMRGALPPPAVDVRPSSVVEAPRLEHSAKPPAFYDIIDRMYPEVRKFELFERDAPSRPWWFGWGNQARAAE